MGDPSDRFFAPREPEVVRPLHPGLTPESTRRLAGGALQQACAAIGADAVDLLIVSGAELAVGASTAAWDGPDRDLALPLSHPALRDVLAGERMRSSAPGTLDALQFGRRGTGAVVAVPLCADGRVTGALVAHARAAADLPTNAEAALGAVGLALGEALREAQRLAAERDHRGALERGVQRLQRLQTATAALAAALDPAKVAHAVVGTAVAALDAAAGSVWLPAEDESHLRIVQAVGYEVGVVERWGRVPLQSRLPVTEAFRSGRSVLLPTQEERDRRYPLLAGERTGNETFAAVPLLLEERALGVLAMSFTGRHALDAEDEIFLDSLALQCAQALDRARLYGAEREARAIAERRHDRLARVAEVGDRLAATSPDQQLEVLTELLVPSLADWCAVDFRTGPRTLRRVERHADPAMMPVLRWEMEHYPVDLDAPEGIGKVIRTGEPRFYPAIDDALWQEIARDAEHLRVLRQADYRSAIIMPLRAPGQVLGAITIARGPAWEAFSEDDLDFASALASRAALALMAARPATPRAPS